MNIIKALIENSSMDYLEQTLIEMFKSYDSAVARYKHSLMSLDEEISSDEILDSVDNSNEVKLALAEVITILNKIQIVFEKLNFTSSTSSVEDTDDYSLVSQLEKFSIQALKLIEDFSREAFPSFVNQLYYLTALVETHYNNQFGELREELEVKPEAEEKLEETEEYLDSLPEVKMNDLK